MLDALLAQVDPLFVLAIVGAMMAVGLLAALAVAVMSRP